MNFLSRLIRKPDVPTSAEYQAMRDLLADTNSYSYQSAKWFVKVRDVIETAPVDTRIDRLRVVMKQKMTTEVGNNVTMFSLEAARMAHERARLLGPVTPDRELTISELTLRADILSPFAFDVIWQTIIPRVKQKLAEHNDPSQS